MGAFSQPNFVFSHQLQYVKKNTMVCIIKDKGLYNLWSFIFIFFLFFFFGQGYARGAPFSLVVAPQRVPSFYKRYLFSILLTVIFFFFFSFLESFFLPLSFFFFFDKSMWKKRASQSEPRAHLRDRLLQQKALSSLYYYYYPWFSFLWKMNNEDPDPC